MHYFHSTLLSAALVAGSLSIAPQAATQRITNDGAATQHSTFFPIPRQGLLIGDKQSQNLVELLDKFAAVTGEHLMYSEDTAALLSNTNSQLTTALEVSPQNVYSVIQDVLIRNRFVLIDVRRTEPRILAVASLNSPELRTATHQSLCIPEEQLGDYAGDSALLMSTVIRLPNMDVRTLGASMRQLIVDPQTMQIIPIPESNSVMVTGYGEAVHHLVHVLRQLEEGAASGAKPSSR